MWPAQCALGLALRHQVLMQLRLHGYEQVYYCPAVSSDFF